ncbi:Xaa-Pro peptidase family protein [Oscillospiraceae bacterium WX1]
MTHLRTIQAAVKTSGTDAVLLTSSTARFYATGFPSTAGVCLVAAEKAWFLTDSRYFEAAKAQIKDAAVLAVGREAPYAKQLNEICAENAIRSLGFEDASMTVSEHAEWQKKLDAVLIASSRLVDDLRAVKSREDLAFLIAAQRIAEKSFEEILPLVGADITEKELAAELVCRFLKNGADDKSFDPIVVSGPRSSLPHGAPSDAKIQKGFLTLDFGVKKDGWCSDTTRTLCVGQPDANMQKIYQAVLNAQEAGIAAVRAGARGCDIDAAARRALEKSGFGTYFTHGFGHGVGLDVHESPSAAPSFDGVIPAGAVLSAEPGVYIPGRYGVRIEDVVYVTQDGCENLTSLPKTLLVV